MTSSDIRNTIREFVHHDLMQDRPAFVLTDETNLLNESIIDSLGIFTLVTFLEEKFAIVIDADEVLVDHFQTVADAANLVEAKLEAATTAKPA